MNILDRYIARQFLLNTGLLFLLLCLFVVMVDVSLNIGRFVEVAGRMATEGSSGVGGDGGGLIRRALITVLLIADLWWPRLVQLFNFVSGIVLIGAMGFTFAQLVRHREVVAILAGGQSLFRAARPVLIVSAVVLLLQVLNQEFLVPRIAPLLTRDAAAAGQRQVASFGVKLTTDAAGRVWQAHSFDPATGVLRGVNIWERNAEGRAIRRLSADEAQFLGGKSWRLLRPRGLTLDAPASNTNPPTAPSSAATSSRAAPDTITTDLEPATLLAHQFTAFSQSLSWRQMFHALSAGQIKPDVREKLERLAWGRLSGLLCSFLALVIAMPFFLTREPVNMVAQSLKAAPVGIGAVMLGVLGSAAAIPGLPPALGALVPVIILLPLAVAAGSSIRT